MHVLRLDDRHLSFAVLWSVVVLSLSLNIEVHLYFNLFRNVLIQA